MQKSTLPEMKSIMRRWAVTSDTETKPSTQRPYVSKFLVFVGVDKTRTGLNAQETTPMDRVLLLQTYLKSYRQVFDVPLIKAKC